MWCFTNSWQHQPCSTQLTGKPMSLVPFSSANLTWLKHKSLSSSCTSSLPSLVSLSGHYRYVSHLWPPSDHWYQESYHSGTKNLTTVIADSGCTRKKWASDLKDNTLFRSAIQSIVSFILHFIYSSFHLFILRLISFLEFANVHYFSFVFSIFILHEKFAKSMKYLILESRNLTEKTVEIILKNPENVQIPKNS